ncbi:divergent polysaccharide deacetylase family protein [Telmatospirillum siberiense]|uniref:Divergent polysaccharide deacetylase family protein n=1 Tax=Telmatospirillum siberiense TaxID=382514 RepID=A0A2N3PZE9_9PROT|nr:divergent polysaccharide deacetylase family protein [Telmatospirillum siberiense]PKU25765.1 hypothetical protein CWS72_04155 [Telmatospirillum siberiense]
MDRFGGFADRLRAWKEAQGQGAFVPLVVEWLFRRRIAIGFALIFCLGLGLGFSAGRLPSGPSAPEAAREAVDKGEGEAATADPQPTETSPHTVVEDEPFGPALPEGQVATLPPASVAPSRLPARENPDWLKYAVPAVGTGGRPMIAVIIDDMGLDKRRSEKVMQLPGPLTISFMSYAQELPRQTGEARAHGHELMMHVPMEPLAEGIDAGPGALSVNLSPEELKRRVEEDLDRFTGYVGINNHMGSKFTAFAPGMQVVMEELQRRGLLFIDSLTTDHSVGLTLAQQLGVPTAARNVFLDNAGDVGAIDAQLAKLEDLARKKGNAIAIGHPRDGTIQALAAWLPTLRAKGLVLVPVSEVVRERRMPVAAGRETRAEVPSAEPRRTR